MGSRIHHSFCCQCFSNFRNRHCISSHYEAPADYLSSLFIHVELLFIIRLALVSVGNSAAASQPVLHAVPEYCFDLLAGIPGIPFVHNVQERGKLVFRRIVAVNAVIHSDKSDILFREQHFRIKVHLKVISPQAAHILYTEDSHVPGIDLIQQGVEARAVKVGSGIPIVRKMTDITENLSLCEVLQIILLVDNAVRLALLLVVSRQPFYKVRLFFLS